MQSFRFEVGKSACPVACKYCFITEHDTRREVWNKNPIAGINKACSFVNVSPFIKDNPQEQERFYSFPWGILAGDIVGFTAITDPFFPVLDEYLWHWVEKVSPIAKLITCVSKWTISDRIMSRLAKIPNFALVLGITGNEPPIERFTVKQHLKTLQLAKDYGVLTLPICHPYIAGVSELSFLREIKAMGYDFMDVKGLRYCDANMGSWMPQVSKHWYLGKEDQEILPEDGWREKVIDAGLTLRSPRYWYSDLVKLVINNPPRLTFEQARDKVNLFLNLANITSSSSSQEVINAAIQRRM
jgi:hypothetical protein